jgi:steroid delta-isomerase-like uncharacterized protein
MTDISTKTGAAQPGSVTMVSEGMGQRERIESVIRQLYDEVISQGKLELVDSLFSPDLKFRHPLSSEMMTGSESFKKALESYRRSFPDLKITITDLIIDGDKVAVRAIDRGTQQGTWLNQAPTNKTIEWTTTEIFRFQDGKIVELCVDEDILGALQQLGITKLQLGF